MIIAEGTNTYITKLERSHVDLMQQWGKHLNPLFYSYNFPNMSLKEKEYWFYQKTKTLSRKSYSVFNKRHELVGYISLRNIKWIRRKSELGIVFDPAKLSQGYGTDSMRAFLACYFGKMGMSQMQLQVAEFNTRARKCYEKCGFRIIGTHYGDFEDQQLGVFRLDQLEPYRKFFKLERGRLKCHYIQMEVTKEFFLAHF